MTVVDTTNKKQCPACFGTGRHGGICGGPLHPLCVLCGGTGIDDRFDDISIYFPPPNAPAELKSAPEQKKYTIEVEIPPTNEDGSCSGKCPLFAVNRLGESCAIGAMTFDASIPGYRPGPNCPRYPGDQS